MKGKKHIKNIEQRARQLLIEAGLHRAPVRVEQLARQLGVKVEPAELGDGVSGVLVVKGSNGKIGYNLSHPLVRQRFSIAHELGHYLLHKDHMQLFVDKTYGAAAKDYGAVAFRDQRSSSGEFVQEREANAFAAALLMPEDLVMEEVEKRGFDLASGTMLDELAEVFQVSTQAMSFRLANLGLLEL